MFKKIDLKGQRFGSLIVNEENGRNKNGYAVWSCLCDCGTIVNVISGSLRSGNTLSCGCLQKKRASIAKTKHGRSRNSEYVIWTQMKKRCTSETYKHYNDYGGRGITVCERWHTFENFFSDMGERPSPQHSIERIDNNRGYYRENCKWATRLEQSRNTRVHKSNKSGYNGVIWDKNGSVWIARITANYIRIHLGSYKKIEDAIEARKHAEIKYWNKQPS